MVVAQSTSSQKGKDVTYAAHDAHMVNTVSNVDKREGIVELSETKHPRSLRIGASLHQFRLHLPITVGARYGRNCREKRGISTRRKAAVGGELMAG